LNCFRSSGAMATNMATPAEGPSFGTAPLGRCTCRSISLKASAEIPSFLARLRTKLNAACADWLGEIPPQPGSDATESGGGCPV
jgi:hypothetical protein